MQGAGLFNSSEVQIGLLSPHGHQRCLSPQSEQFEIWISSPFGLQLGQIGVKHVSHGVGNGLLAHRGYVSLSISVPFSTFIVCYEY